MDQWLASLRESSVDLSTSIASSLPRLALALLLVAVGWSVAWLLRSLVRLLVRRLEELIRRRTGGEATREQRVASRFVGAITFWVVFLFFVASATQQLGLPVVTEALSTFAGYLPAALGCVLILLFAFLFADFAKRGVVSAAAAAGLLYAGLLGQVTKVLILVVASVLALDQLGVNSTILVILVATLFGALIGAATLAFGLGARTTVSNILASHYLLQTYRPGQTIQVRNITGRIVDIKPSGVILDAAEGQVVVPAKTFNESISVLVREEH